MRRKGWKGRERMRKKTERTKEKRRPREKAGRGEGKGSMMVNPHCYHRNMPALGVSVSVSPERLNPAETTQTE